MKYTVYIALFLLALISGLPWSPLFKAPDTDPHVYHYIGMLIHNGMMPYLDVFDHKPPVIYLLYGLTFGLKYWGIWLLDRLILFFTASLLHRFLKNRKTSFPFLISIIFILLYALPGFYPGMTRFYSSCFTLWGVLLLCSEVSRKYFFSGILLGLIFLTQPNDILPLAGFAMYMIWRRKHFIKKALVFFSSSLLAFIPFLIWFAFNQTLYDFYDQVFVFNFSCYIDQSIEPNRLLKLKSFLYHFLTIGLLNPFILAVGLNTFQKSDTLKNLKIPILIAVALQAISASVGFIIYRYYYLGMIPWIVLLLASGTNTETIKKYKTLFLILLVIIGLQLLSTQLVINFHQGKYPQLNLLNLAVIPFAVLFAISLLSRQLKTLHLLWALIFMIPISAPQHDPYNMYVGLREHKTAYEDFSDVNKYLKPLRHQRGQLYVMGHRGGTRGFNAYFEIPSPSKWLFIDHWYYSKCFSEEDEVLNLIDNISRFHTKFLILHPKKIIKSNASHQKWIKFIGGHYDKVEILTDGYILWKIKSKP